MSPEDWLEFSRKVKELKDRDKLEKLKGEIPGGFELIGSSQVPYCCDNDDHWDFWSEGDGTFWFKYHNQEPIHYRFTEKALEQRYEVPPESTKFVCNTSNCKKGFVNKHWLKVHRDREHRI